MEIKDLMADKLKLQKIILCISDMAQKKKSHHLMGNFLLLILPTSSGIKILLRYPLDLE